ncbi:hypothetical protein H5410_023084 [Solanum commersonii]|uniref:Uncharacterized protein n=1 Tax=Solanum commersonii TaxID=4109 RepID=A0A9J5ZFU9_SOLCO|nr:hypothetical protein H5410_023084 [Solanum commersonii]
METHQRTDSNRPGMNGFVQQKYPPLYTKDPTTGINSVIVSKAMRDSASPSREKVTVATRNEYPFSTAGSNHHNLSSDVTMDIVSINYNAPIISVQM